MSGMRRRRGRRVSLTTEGPQLVIQPSRRLETIGGILGQALVDDAAEVSRQIYSTRFNRRRILVHDRRCEIDRGVAVEGTLTGRHLVQNDAEREDVGARIDRLSLQLLRGHVGEGPDNLSGLGP